MRRAKQRIGDMTLGSVVVVVLVGGTLILIVLVLLVLALIAGWLGWDPVEIPT